MRFARKIYFAKSKRKKISYYKFSDISNIPARLLRYFGKPKEERGQVLECSISKHLTTEIFYSKEHT